MSFLTEVLARKWEELDRAKRQRPEARLLAEIAERRESRRDFIASLRGGRPAIVAEVKRRSPSSGLLALDLDLPRLVADYDRGGATAVSVLTDEPSFGGSLSDLGTARRATSLPLLRKDFILDPYQVVEAAWAGADAVLLIVRCLSIPQLKESLAACRMLGLGALVEAHTEDDLASTAHLGIEAYGINNRDLATLAVDPSTVPRLLSFVPREALVVAESGITTPAEAARLARTGIDAVLVGEAFVRCHDPAAMVRAFREAESRAG